MRRASFDDAMRRKTYTWSEAETERLKALIASGASLLRVTGALNRSKSSIQKKAHDLGAPFPPVAQQNKKLRGTEATP
jgi:predicted transcriptional regulator